MISQPHPETTRRPPALPEGGASPVAPAMGRAQDHPCVSRDGEPGVPLDATMQHLFSAIRTLDPTRFKTWSSYGLTTPQLRLLFLIRDEPGVTAGSLAHAVGVAPSTISGIVDRLVRQRLVLRQGDAIDRRLVRNSLTELGQDICSRVAVENRRAVEPILSAMAPVDRACLDRGLEAFLAARGLVADVRPPESAPEDSGD